MADEKVLRLFLDLNPLQFVDVTVPKDANFLYLMNMWRNQGFLITERDFIDWRFVIGVRELPLPPETMEEIKADKARLN